MSDSDSTGGGSDANGPDGDANEPDANAHDGDSAEPDANAPGGDAPDLGDANEPDGDAAEFSGAAEPDGDAGELGDAAEPGGVAGRSERQRQRRRPAVILASASPRRLELLRRLGIEPIVIPANVDESQLPGESPADYVLRVATDKAHAATSAATDVAGGTVTWPIVLAADTSVVLEGDILGKPDDAQDALRMLTSLARRSHDVLTAVVVIGPDSIEHGVVTRTTVRFAEVSRSEIEWYISTGEPFGKAGAYAIQGIGEFLVESIDGSPSTVIGLPLRPTVDLLRVAGYEWPAEG